MRFVLISGAVLFSVLNKLTVKPNYLPAGSAYSHLLSDNTEYYMAIDMF
ncbi:type VI secretion system tube protein Hcp, partial [Cronobacter sakazakii]